MGCAVLTMSCGIAEMTGLTSEFNVAISVNHPLFVAAYVQTVLPLLHNCRKSNGRQSTCCRL